MNQFVRRPFKVFSLVSSAVVLTAFIFYPSVVKNVISRTILPMHFLQSSDDKVVSRLTTKSRPTKKEDPLSTQQCDTRCQEQIQLTRKTHLATTCKLLGLDRNDSSKHRPILSKATLKEMDHLLVLDEYKTIYCFIPKTGCTNWKRIFLLLKRKVSSVDQTEQHETHTLVKENIRNLSSYTVKEATNILRSYSSFIFVRNPFVRTLSAYRDKIEEPTKLNRGFRAKWNNYIHLGISRNISKSTSFLGNYSTFIDYVKYLSNNYVNDDHWKTMFELCHPCTVRYGFIGKMETLERDVNYVLEKIIGNKSEGMTYINSTNPTGSKLSMNQYYTRVPSHLQQALYYKYERDFLLFGYNKSDSLN